MVMTESQLSQKLRAIGNTASGYRLWRNNRGKYIDQRGNWVHYGIPTSSGGSDFIGIRPVTITEDMVGKTIGQFVAVEVKSESGMKPRDKKSKDRMISQCRFLMQVEDIGGFSELVHPNNFTEFETQLFSNLLK